MWNVVCGAYNKKKILICLSNSSYTKHEEICNASISGWISRFYGITRKHLYFGVEGNRGGQFPPLTVFVFFLGGRLAEPEKTLAHVILKNFYQYMCVSLYIYSLKDPWPLSRSVFLFLLSMKFPSFLYPVDSRWSSRSQRIVSAAVSTQVSIDLYRYNSCVSKEKFLARFRETKLSKYIKFCVTKCCTE